VILPTGGHDHMGCFTNQVKLTRALVQNLDEAIKEVKLLGEHEEESSQKITKLKALCNKLRENTQRLEEEEEEDADDGGDATAPPAAAPPPLAPPAVVPKEIDEEGPVEAIPEQEAPIPHEVVLADAKPEVPQLRLYHALLRDYEENPLRLEDDFDDLDDDPNEGRSDMDEWFPEDGSNDRVGSLGLSLKSRIKIKFLGST
jgi:hypothetical protein